MESSEIKYPPILFLDVDGVLTTSRGLLRQYSGSDSTLFHDIVSDIPPLEKKLINNLRILIEKVTDLRIVISSTWREYEDYMEFLLESLKVGGIDVDAVILGRTPNLASSGRGAEVFQWLELNPGHKIFAIVDDGHEESFEEYGFLDRFVKTRIGGTHPELEGLTLDAVKKLLKLYSIEESS
jgi:hypothetical protein